MNNDYIDKIFDIILDAKIDLTEEEFKKLLLMIEMITNYYQYNKFKV